MKFPVLLLLLLVSSTAFAQSSARFNIARGVISGGGMMFSTSSRYRLASTIGQPLAATPSSSRFSIKGGFWSATNSSVVTINVVIGTSHFLPNGQFQLTISGGVSGQNYEIETSTNLVNWTVLTNFTGTNTPFYFDDAQTTNFKERFYRTVMP
jgi:hypothetical protein